MKASFPSQLGNSPLVEALFELRFEPTNLGLGDLLPGLLFATMGTSYPNVSRLPLASIPREIRDRNTDLLYQPSHQLGDAPNSIRVGDRVILISSQQYPGWNRFKEMTQDLIKHVKETGTIDTVARFSLKYVNVLSTVAPEKQLPLLKMLISVNGNPPDERGFRLRTELHENNFITILEIITNATAKVIGPTGQAFGLLVTVDTLTTKIGKDFLDNPGDLLEQCHNAAKSTFFNLLTPEGLSRLKPVES